MKKQSKILALIFLIILFLIGMNQSVLAQNRIDVYFFWGEGCPHCEKEMVFWQEMKKKYSNLTVHDFEVNHVDGNLELVKKIADNLGVAVQGVPYTVVADQVFVGYNDFNIANGMEARVIKCSSMACSDSVAQIVGVAQKEVIDIQTEVDRFVDGVGNGSIEADIVISENNETSENSERSTFNVPFLGKIDALSVSLPLVTLVLGALDGFNPCAMWVLLFLISMLFGMENKKRMWALGSAFIVASGLVYFLMMVAWLNLILFIGLVFWFRLLIGGVALVGGGYSLKEFFTNKEGTCNVTGSEQRQRVFERIKKIVHEHSFWLALIGIVLLAFLVNLVELVCSAGFPVVFTQILAINNLAIWQYYLYILLYVFVFMLDDLVVFFIAMITLQVTGITTKYTRVSRLIGGLLLLIIGLLLILKPEVLML